MSLYRICFILLLSLTLSMALTLRPRTRFARRNVLLNRQPKDPASSRRKVERLGELLKKRVADLRSSESGQVELVFLVDASGSVGHADFKNELTFVRKLLADFTVEAEATRVALVTFSSRSRVLREVDQIGSPGPDQQKCSLLQDYLPNVTYTGGGTFTLGAMREAKVGPRPCCNIKTVFPGNGMPIIKVPS